jgi:hypothetical protein
MEPEPKQPKPLPSTPLQSPVVNLVPARSPAQVCPWENFLIGKKVSPEKFLTTMAKGAITLPDDATRKRFVEALLAKPEHMTRFISLLQASTASGDTLRRIITEFAEAAIRRLQLIALPEPLDATAFGQSVSSWLAGIPRKPLAPPDLNLLFLLLHFGSLRQVLDHDTAFGLVASAVSKSGKPSRKDARKTEPQTPLDVLLAASPARPVLATLIAHAKTTDKETVEVKHRVEQQVEEITGLAAEVVRLEATITGLRTEITVLKEQKDAADQKIHELERQIVEIHDGYRHKLDDLRGKIRGILQGELTRWIETALDAARSDPPFTKAIEERLEDALKLITKELKWLQPSA